MRDLAAILWTSMLPMLAIGIGLVIERIAGRKERARGLGLNAGLLLASKTVNHLAFPVILPVAAVFVHRLGAGFIHLGGGALAALVLIVASDFFNYWQHRLAHAWLWPLHSLHHSDPDFGTSTLARRHLLDAFLYRATVTIPVAILFTADGAAFYVTSLVALTWNVVTHIRFKVHLGRFAAVITGPQMHWIHHSCLHEHADKNFAALLPVWDVLFGTYYAPKPGEYPPTGLVDGRAPVTVWQALVWPLGRGVHRLAPR